MSSVCSRSKLQLMNLEPPASPPQPIPRISAPPPRPEAGCGRVLLFVLLGLALMGITVLGILYYVVMHTSVPFSALESMLASANTNADFKVQGITGSLASGFRIQSIRWGKEETGGGIIEDVRVSYSGFWDLIGGHRIIFRELRIGKAHFDISGLENAFDPSAFRAQQHQNANNSGRSSRPLQLFQIDRFTVEDVVLTNTAAHSSIRIPKVEWKGFKIAHGTVDFGNVSVDSDRLVVQTKPGETLQLGGAPVSFQKKLEGKILPPMSKELLEPISFELYLAVNQTKMFYALKAFDSQLTVYSDADKAGFAACTNLDLQRYLKSPLPRDLTFFASLVEAPSFRERFRFKNGEFDLGQKHFVIHPEAAEASGEDSAPAWTAICMDGRTQFIYEVATAPGSWKWEQRLRSEPPLELNDIVARIFTSKQYSQLDTNQQAEVDARSDWFSQPQKQE
jgi:hypothetical protein